MDYCETGSRDSTVKKRILRERSWCKEGIRYWQRKDYEIIDEMKTKYSVKLLCELLDVSRSGYYKWLKRKDTPNRYEQDRAILTELLQDAHEKHPSYGYHRLAQAVRNETGWLFSHNLAHKCCKHAGIYSLARKHRKYRKPGEESIKFPNLVRGRWNVCRPLELVTSDMTMFKNNGKWYEWTLLVDVFNNEILAHSVTDKPGYNKPYYDCLDELKRLAGTKKEQNSPITFHTDQGAVYSSKAYCLAHAEYNIIRSMSRGGTPTDNPVIEALNGWIKEELYRGFDLANAPDVPALLDKYVTYYNEVRAAYSLDYKSPVQYRIEQGF
ncbi:MAG: IS3 family transposase [Mogibacterium sp.]|nr:IS3 family transposase [Mogibacterium sp.]